MDKLADVVASTFNATFLKLPSHPTAIDARANHCRLPLSDLWFCSYGMPVAIKFPEADHVRVQFRHTGIGATWIGDHMVPITENRACISIGAAEFDFGADFQQIVWRVRKAVLIQKLSTLTGGYTFGDLTFDHDLDLSHPQAATLRKILDCLLHAADTIRGEPSKVVLAELEQALIVSFLSVSRHGSSGMLDRKALGAAPWQVRRAENYIAANWDKPITIEDLAAVAGTSARSLFRTFKQSRGHSPLEFARRVRLANARRMLQNPESTTTVTDIALACGFGDLGRFSKDFSLAFGEPPSVVLNRAKGRHQTVQ